MIQDDLQYKIGLTLIKGVGPVLAKNLLAYLGSAKNIFYEKKQHLSKIPGIGDFLAREITSQDVMKRAEQEVEFTLKNNIQVHFFADKTYPYRLKECNDSPVVLYYKGNKDLNESRFLSIVGTRNATDYGKDLCKAFIQEISQKQPNITIISGLAYGIDICAHKFTLESGMSTIGVLGHGLDRIYPSAHRPTAVKMLEKGGLLSEYTSGTTPDRQNFVQRNRIIAGMSDAIVVIESAEKGGALITAELGNDYNRDVFAIPGRVNDEWSKGCNKLIKENKAALIQTPEDLLHFMNWETVTNNVSEIQTSLFLDLTSDEVEVIEELRNRPNGVNVNELTVKLNIPYSKLSSRLLDMEFKGLVKCLPGGVYKIVR